MTRGRHFLLDPIILPASPGRIQPLWRFVAATAIVWSGLALYFVITYHPTSPPVTVEMPSWVPFWPIFAVPYLGMLFAAWLLPVAIRDAGRFRACLRAMTYAFLLVIPWWVLIPTRLHRPPMPEGWWVGVYQWLTVHDPPNCVLPCAHGIGATVAAWFLALDRPKWRWPLAGMLVVGIPSIALIGQHRPVDILIGTVAAIAGIFLAERFSGREQARFQALEKLPV
jgi:hypothetical protein